MSDEYIIRSRIVVDDASAPGAESAERRLRHVEAQGHRTGISITNAFQQAFAVIGGATGVGMAVKGVVGLHAAAQDAQNGIAALLSVQTGAPINTALSVARDLVADLRKDAAAGVGEFADYQQGLQAILSPGMGAGGSLDQLRELNRLAVAAGGALRGVEGTRLGPLDVAQALTSSASRMETPIVSQALAAAGVTEKQFNAMDSAKRLETLLAAFGKFGPAVELMGKSWNAQMSTLMDNIKGIIGDVTRPLFDRWSLQLQDANKWLEGHKSHLASIVDTWGPRLVSLWDHLLKQAGTYTALVGAGVFMQATGMGGGFMRTAAGALRGGALAGGLVGGEVSVVSAGSVLASAVTPLLLVTAGFLAVKGAIGEYPQLLPWIAGEATKLTLALGNLGASFGMLTEKGSALNIVGIAIVGFFGLQIKMLTEATKWISTFTTGLGVMLQVIGDGFKAIYYAGTGQFDKAAKLSVMDRLTNANERLKGIWGKPADTSARDSLMKQLREEMLGKVKTDLPNTKPPVVNVGQVTINQRIEPNDDPVRIIRAFDQAIEHVNKYARQARRIPVPVL